MPKVVGMYESERKGLKHNLGGIFSKPKKNQKQVPGTEPKESEGKISDVGKEARSAIERRKKALKEAMAD